jgi:hypothetical protein
MSSKHLVDPELWAGLELFPSLVFSSDMLLIARQQVAAVEAAMPPPDTRDVSIEERTIPNARFKEVEFGE